MYDTLSLTASATVAPFSKALSPALRAALDRPEVREILVRSVLLDALEAWIEEAQDLLGEDARAAIDAALPALDGAAIRWWDARREEALIALLCATEAVQGVRVAETRLHERE